MIIRAHASRNMSRESRSEGTDKRLWSRRRSRWKKKRVGQSKIVLEGASFRNLRSPLAGDMRIRLFYLTVDERIAGETLLAKAKLLEAIQEENLKWDSLKALAAVLLARGQAQQKSFEDASAVANALADADEKQNALAAAQSLQETSAAKSLRAELDAINGTGISKHIYDKFLEAHVPQFLYFDEYYQMRGCENIEALQKRIAANQLKPSDYPLLGLIELAGLKLEELLNPARTQELKNKLQGAGNHLTGKILKYWSQNRHLRLAFDVRPARPGDPEGMREGTNIWAEVADQKHFVNTALGTRSRGFVWFFSFLAWYSRLKSTTQQRIILLLDEPGLSLHARAQEDLLRYFEEELKGDHQVLYSTHSPFMVDVKHFERVRIVQDRTIDSDAVLPPGRGGDQRSWLTCSKPERIAFFLCKVPWGTKSTRGSSSDQTASWWKERRTFCTFQCFLRFSRKTAE